MKLKAQIMDEAALGRALMRISHEIDEHNRGVDNVVLVGVRRRGEPIAQRIRGNIHKIEDKESASIATISASSPPSRRPAAPRCPLT